jgi:hypothetical protein
MRVHTATELIEAKLNALREGLYDYDRPKPHAGWIDPAKGYHRLDANQHHLDWSLKNSDHVNSFGVTHVGDLEQVIGDDDHNRDSVANSMLQSGWIRKAAPDSYEFHKKHMGSVLAHVKKHHPDVTYIYTDTHDDGGFLNSSKRLVR